MQDFNKQAFVVQATFLAHTNSLIRLFTLTFDHPCMVWFQHVVNSMQHLNEVLSHLLMF